jgi:hypothetical protein
MKFLNQFKKIQDSIAEQTELLLEQGLVKFRESFDCVDEDTQQYRIDICAQCEYLFEPTMSCKKCGCFMKAKTWLADQECPVGKWEKISVKDLSQQ